MKYLRSIFFLIQLCFTSSLYAQITQVIGVVTDAKTKEPIPFVSILFKGTRQGNVSDVNGRFIVKSIEPSDSLLVSYMGFKTQVIRIKRNAAQVLNIELQPAGMELQEVVVKNQKRQKFIKDTTALLVYHNVVNHKEINRPDHIAAFSYNSYTKLELDMMNISDKFQKSIFLRPFKFAFEQQDTTEDGKKFIPALIREKISDVYQRKSPRATKEIQRAVKVSGLENQSIGTLAEFQFDVTEVYDNVTQIAGRSFIMPFSPIATGTYRYFLDDTAILGGRLSYLLKFAPISKEDLAFTGSAWIDSATWAIRSIDFYPNQKANLNFITDYHIKQQFTFYENKYWFMDEEKIQAIVTIYDNKKQLSALVKKTHSRRNPSFDLNFDKNFFQGDPFVIDDSSKYRNDNYWQDKRHEQLSAKEKMIYLVVDSLKKTRTLKAYQWISQSISSAYLNTGPVEFGKIYQWFSRNSVEGYRAKMGFRTNTSFSKKFQLEGYAAYGFHDKDWKYMALGRYMLPRRNNKWSLLEAHYKYDVSILGLDNPLFTHDNILTMMRKKPLQKVMKVSEYAIHWEKEWRTGITTTFGFTRRHFYAQPEYIPFNRVEPDGSLTSIPGFSLTEFSVSNRIGIREKYYENLFRRQFLNTKYPVFTLGLTVGVKKFLGGDYNYQKIDIEIKQRLPSPIGYTKYSIKYGKVFGKPAFPALYLTAGNVSFMYDKFNYNLLRQFEFISDQYFALWFDHHFDGLLFNKIPGFNRLKLRELITFKMLVGTLSSKRRDVLVIPSDLRVPGPVPYIEAGFGIENIFKLIRVDFLWRLTYRNTPNAPNFGVRILVQPTF